jgi:hypothetical protein
VARAASTDRREVAATMSVVKVPHRQRKTRCSIFANFGCCSDRTNVVGRPHASQIGFFGVFFRMSIDPPTRSHGFRSRRFE